MTNRQKYKSAYVSSSTYLPGHTDVNYRSNTVYDPESEELSDLENFRLLNIPLIKKTKRVAERSTKASFNTILKFKNPYITKEARNLFKSVLGYFIGSLFTYLNFLKVFTGSSSHMTAISVFFMSPSQTVGNFVESMIFGSLFIFYGLISAYLGMVNIVMWNYFEMPNIAKFTSICILGCSCFALSYIKSAFPKPSLVKCISNAFIIIFVVTVNETVFLTKNIETKKLVHLAKALFFGMGINSFICFFVFPRWESDNLEKHILKTLESLKFILPKLKDVFQLKENINVSEIKSDLERHKKTFLILEKSYKNTKMEFFFNEEKWISIGKVIHSLNVLGQKLNSLNTCIETQFGILQTKHQNIKMKSLNNNIIFKNNSQSKNTIAKIDLGVDTDNIVFLEFIKLLSKPVKKLIKKYIDLIREVGLYSKFVLNSKKKSETNTLKKLIQDIENYIKEFDMFYTSSTDELYKETSFDGKPNNELLTVHFFVFCLREFGTELIVFARNFEDLINSIESTPKISVFFYVKKLIIKLSIVSYEDKIIKMLFDSTFKETRKEKHNIFSYKIWRFLEFLRTPNMKFAIKSSAASILVIIPAFLDNYKHSFKEWKGSWILISMMVIMSPTVGASNIISVYRICGTILGGMIGYIVDYLFPDELYALIPISTILSIPCLYMYLETPYPKIGQFTLITYNLIVLKHFSFKHRPEYTLLYLAVTRVFAVSCGVLIGVVFTSWVFPNKSRVLLRKGLSKFLSNTSVLYLKISKLYNEQNTDDKSHYIPSNENSCAQSSDKIEFVFMELHLQRSILFLKELSTNTLNEPRLKGRFPKEHFDKIISSSQNILDKLLTIRIVITKKEWNEHVRKDFVIPLNEFKCELNGCIMLFFYILETSLLSKLPLPVYMPPVNQAQERMIKALRNLSVVKSLIIFENRNHHIYYYAFFVLIDDIVSELEYMETVIRDLFGSKG